MKKILISLAMIAVVGAIVVSSTTAFFSDTETSSGNTFTAGSIDLKIDNESYYNGERSTDTSWQLADLDDGSGPVDGKYLFFNFNDLKPGDWGEDTISLHVTDNDSWLCADVTLTSNQENNITEPEAKMDDDDASGELAQELYFVWWADDGDNVLEDDEYVMPISNLGQAPLDQTVTVALADTSGNGLWDSPLTGEEPYYIGKAWCFGDLTLAPVPAGDGNDPTTNPGILCDGAPVTNISQSDSATLDVSFTALQSRHNDSFVCGQEPPEITQCEGWDCLANLEKAIFTTGRYENQANLAQTWEMAIWEKTGGNEYVRSDDGADSSSFDWENGVPENFTFSYDPSDGSVVYTIGSKTITWTYDTGKKFTHIIPFVKGNGNGNNTKLTNLMVDGLAIPDLDSGNVYKGTIVPLTDAQQVNGFTVTGNATLNWSASPANELPAFHIFTMGVH